MKTDSTRIALYRLLIFIFLLLYSLLVFAQSNPDPTILPARSLFQLGAQDKPDGVELSGMLMASHTYNKIVIERKSENSTFTIISELPITDNSTLYPFKYLDTRALPGTNYYRVRLINSIHNLQEISNILMIRRDEKEIKELRLINTMLQSANPVITLNSLSEKEIILQITDMSGHEMTMTKIALNHGSTQYYLPNLAGRLGYFVVVLKTPKSITKQKIIIQ